MLRHAVGCLALILSLSALPAASETGWIESPSLKVRWVDGGLSVEVVAAPASQVFEEIGRAAGVEILLQKDLSSRPISESFEGLRLDRCLARLAKALGASTTAVLYHNGKPVKAVVGKISGELQRFRAAVGSAGRRASTSTPAASTAPDPAEVEISSPPPPDPSNLLRYLAGSRQTRQYHRLNCQMAMRIPNAEKTWFRSREQAEQHGYSPHELCIR